jgi:hypothetical protein
MSNLKNPAWWAAAGTRAIKTVAQTAIATIGTSALISQVDWLTVASASVWPGCCPADVTGRTAGVEE